MKTLNDRSREKKLRGLLKIIGWFGQRFVCYGTASRIHFSANCQWTEPKRKKKRKKETKQKLIDGDRHTKNYVSAKSVIFIDWLLISLTRLEAENCVVCSRIPCIIIIIIVAHIIIIVLLYTLLYCTSLLHSHFYVWKFSFILFLLFFRLRSFVWTVWSVTTSNYYYIHISNFLLAVYLSKLVVVVVLPLLHSSFLFL